MKEKKLMYSCLTCGKKTERSEKDTTPECCGQKMALEGFEKKPCNHAMHPEMARNTDDDEPCDDGRGEGVN